MGLRVLVFHRPSPSRPGTTLVYIQQPTDGTAGVAISPAVTIRARDQLGNNAQGVSVTMTLKAGSSGTLSGTVTRVTDSSGVATFNDLSINLAGSKTLRATGNSLTPVDSSAFVISGATATKLVFTTQPSGATAGAAFNTQPVVQSQDSFGNNSSSGLPASLLVSVALTSGTGPLQGTTTTDIGSGSGTPGVAAFTDLRIDILGSKQLTASASGLTSVQSSSFNVSPGAAASLQIQTQPPSTATAGSTFSSATVVRLLDAFGNLATNDSSTVVTAARSAGTGTALLGGTTAVTAVNGVATFSTLRYDKAEAITITFSSGSLTSATSSTVTVSPAAASKLAIVVPPSTTATAGFVFAQQPQIQIQDQFGNLCTNNSTVTAARSAGSGNLQGTTNVNAVGGVATFTDLAHNVATNITILFSSSGLASTTSGTISVSPSGEHPLAIQTQPSLTATAGVAFAQQPVIRIEDQFNNMVTNDNTTIVMADRNAGSGLLQGDTDILASNGRIVFSNLAHTVATNITIDFSADDLIGVPSSNININPAAAASLAFTAQPGDGAAGTFLSPSVTIQALDSFGNSVAGLPVSIALTTGTGALSGTTTRSTDTNGVATFNDLSINLAGTKKLTATSGALSTGESDPFVISAGAAHRSEERRVGKECRSR